MGSRVPVAAIIVVMLALAGYFTWIMIQMAKYQTGGLYLLAKIMIGIGVVIVIPGVIVGVLNAHDRFKEREGSDR